MAKVQLPPIILTEFGDALEPYPGRTWETKLVDILGSHCQHAGDVRLIKTSSTTHNVIVCPHCYFRFLIPKEINTFAKLHEWCAKKMQEREKTWAELNKVMVQNALIG